MIGIPEADGGDVREINVEPDSWRLMFVNRRCHLLVLRWPQLFFSQVVECSIWEEGRGSKQLQRMRNITLLKICSLTAGSAYAPKEAFDHNMNESINLFFIPKSEPKTAVSC